MRLRVGRIPLRRPGRGCRSGHIAESGARRVLPSPVGGHFMPRRTRRWSFVFGVLLVLAGLALFAQPLIAGTGVAAPSARPLAVDEVVVSDEAACCRVDRRRVEFDPAPAAGLLGIGGLMMLFAAVATGTSPRRVPEYDVDALHEQHPASA